LIGQVCKDEILIQSLEKVWRSIGGSVFYGSMTLKCLGGEPIVLTKLNPIDQKILLPFREWDIQYYWWKSHKTTFFQNIYDRDRDCREQNLLEDADPISLQEIRDIVKTNSLQIVVCPLTSDFIPISLLKYFSENTLNVNVSLQGYLRDNSTQKIKLIKPKNIHKILSHSKLVCLNKAEAKVIGETENTEKSAKWISQQGPKEVIITEGSKGGVYYSENDYFTYSIPKSKISKKDPTGAGDIFLSCFLYMRSKNAPSRECIDYAVDTTFSLLEKRENLFNIEWM
jgi:sugar/nucleoside kinase (ribokinase family)